MHIFCPKCKAGYQVDIQESVVATHRLKCGNCGNIFRLDVDKIDEETQNDAFGLLQEAMDSQTDAVEEINKVEETVVDDLGYEPYLELPKDTIENIESEKSEEIDVNDDESVQEKETRDMSMDEVFLRWSESAENVLKEEKKLSRFKRWSMRTRSFLGQKFIRNSRYLVFAVAVLGVFWLYNNRYEVVRNFPEGRMLYRLLGINTEIVGAGLDFKDINWEIQKSEKGVVLNITGFIANETGDKLSVPAIMVKMLDEDAKLLRHQIIKTEVTDIVAGERAPLSLTIDKPNTNLKYIYIKFDQNQ